MKMTPPLSLDANLAPARLGALQSVQESVSTATANAPPVEPVIPVDAYGWETVLEDAQVVEHVRRLLGDVAAVDALDVNDPAVIGGALRRTLSAAGATLIRLINCVEQAAWFVPPAGREEDRDALLRLRGLALDVITGCLEALIATGTAASLDAWSASAAELESLVDELADRPEIAENKIDAVELVFGAAADRFRDRRGVIDSARLRAFYATRPQELEQISRRMLKSLLSDAGVLPPDAATYAAAFTLSERPLICHQVAREALGEIRRRFAADPAATAAALARRFIRIKHSASTHFDGIVPTATRLALAQSDGERARLALELYRLTSEGPMRQTGWGYLELRGHAPRKPPMLSEVRDLLLADSAPLALLIAGAIHPEWRNPASHEEHHWDAAAERIVVGDATATVAEVNDAAGYAMSVMHGFETGLACARLLIDELGQRLEGEDAVDEAPLVDRRVRNAIGRQGVYVWDTNWRGDTVEVVVEADLDHELHAVLAGILGASLEAPPSTCWQVSERDGASRIELSAHATAASRALLAPGARDGPLDVNVLLPLLAAFKVAAGEPPTDIAVDIARSALKHPLVTSQDEAVAIVRRDGGVIARLVAALDVAERALAVTWDLIGTDVGQRPLLEQLRAARLAAGEWQRGGRAQRDALDRDLNQLYDAYHALPERPLRVPTARAE